MREPLYHEAGRDAYDEKENGKGERLRREGCAAVDFPLPIGEDFRS